ncbi:hypothetical protein [Terribacillus sp. JSM ZJ617]|uniref:hypothetical protein n=1 Tax=Terribacillus sp. JSM ZJ617 TaxID=3342119 RepID=UPI0035A8A9DF
MKFNVTFVFNDGTSYKFKEFEKPSYNALLHSICESHDGWFGKDENFVHLANVTRFHIQTIE